MPATYKTCRLLFTQRKICSCILLFFIFTSPCFSQPKTTLDYFQRPDVKHTIDSLKKKLPTLTSIERINCLNALSNVYLVKGGITKQTDTAASYAQEALADAQKLDYIKGKAEAYEYLGRIESTFGTDLAATEKYFDSSLFYFKMMGDEKQIAWSWGAVGFAKWVVGKFESSLKAYQKAVKFYEETGDTANLVILYAQMSNTALEWGHYDEALQYALKNKDLTGKENYSILGRLYGKVGDKKTSLDYFRKAPKEDGWYYLGLGKAYFQNELYDSAMYCYNNFADFAKTAGESVLSKSYAHLGELYLSLKNYDSSIFYLRKALLMHTKANDVNQVVWVTLTLGKAYTATKNDTAAIQLTRELLQTAQKIGTRQYLLDAHFLMYQIFLRQQAKDSAFYHLQKYLALKDEIDNENFSQKLSFYRIAIEKEKDEGRINLLKKEQQLQQQLFTKTKQQKNLFIVSLVVLCLGAVIFFHNKLQNKKNEKLILQKTMEMQRLENEKTKASLQQQSTELKMQALRAQMNPHFIYNSLGSINLFILENNQAKASEFLIKFSRLVRLILQNSLSAFITLDKELEALKLYLELESLRFDNHFSFNINIEHELDTAVIKVPPIILQPYAENAIWHGLMHKEEQGKLDIEIYQVEDFIYCSVTDNGIGIYKAAALKRKSEVADTSLGMKLSADRIAMLYQHVEVKASVKVENLVLPDGTAGGTQILLKIPLHYD